MTRRIKRIGINWETPEGNDFRWEHVIVEMLMDIRSELQRLNNVLQCPNFIAVPSKLDQIAKNTRKRKRPKVTGKPKLRVVR